ncbi:fibronectin type III domain-containing protein [Fontivita pretiosa]|uniref:fibronectin type III domain-containing protein n=1 Tax=Fontivita pretiosa TaxID=2989684 RepID=UPI003D16374D
MNRSLRRCTFSSIETLEKRCLLSAPAAPQYLTALTIGPDQVNVTWQDKSTDEDGFKIEYSTNENFSSFQTIVAAPNTGSKWITGLQASTTYHFRVRATSLTGGDSGISSSGTARAATPTANPTVVNVMTAYGANPNDSADDYAAIQQAINQSPANSVIYFPAGNTANDKYLVSQKILVKGGGRIHKGDTILSTGTDATPTGQQSIIRSTANDANPQNNTVFYIHENTAPQTCST